MAQVVVSTKFQIVIPKQVRQEIGLKSGQVVQIISKSGVITMVPDQPVGRNAERGNGHGPPAGGVVRVGPADRHCGA